MVEDEQNLRRLLSLVLERAGYRVLEAGDAEEALALWQEHAQTVALLLTDLVMPGRLNGRALAKRLQESRPGLPVIFLSGYDLQAGEEKPSATPGEILLQKPCPPTQLLTTVRRCLDRAPG